MYIHVQIPHDECTYYVSKLKPIAHKTGDKGGWKQEHRCWILMQNSRETLVAWTMAVLLNSLEY